MERSGEAAASPRSSLATPWGWGENICVSFASHLHAALLTSEGPGASCPRLVCPAFLGSRAGRRGGVAPPPAPPTCSDFCQSLRAAEEGGTHTRGF